MALPDERGYIPIKVIYVLQGPKTGQPYFKHGVGFNEDGRGATSSYADRSVLVNSLGFKDITNQHWAAKKKEWEKLVKEEESKKSKKKAEPEPEEEGSGKRVYEVPLAELPKSYGKKKKG